MSRGSLHCTHCSKSRTPCSHGVVIARIQLSFCNRKCSTFSSGDALSIHAFARSSASFSSSLITANHSLAAWRVPQFYPSSVHSKPLPQFRTPVRFSDPRKQRPEMRKNPQKTFPSYPPPPSGGGNWGNWGLCLSATPVPQFSPVRVLELGKKKQVTKSCPYDPRRSCFAFPLRRRNRL